MASTLPEHNEKITLSIRSMSLRLDGGGFESRAYHASDRILVLLLSCVTGALQVLSFFKSWLVGMAD